MDLRRQDFGPVRWRSWGTTPSRHVLWKLIVILFVGSIALDLAVRAGWLQ